MNTKQLLSLAFGCLIALPAFTQTKLGTLKQYKDSLTFKTVPSKTKTATGTATIRTDTVFVWQSPDGKLKRGVVKWNADSIPPIPPNPGGDTATYYLDDAHAIYTGAWTHGKNNSQAYAGTFSYGNERGGTIKETFDGTALKWYASKYPTHGIAELKIDALPAVRINLYSATNQVGVLVYATKEPLQPGHHTVTITVTGDKSTASTNTWVEHDAFKITGTKPTPPEPPHGTGQWYVDDIGKDTNDGSKANPFLTIQKAATVAHSGDTIVVLSGTFRETITPTNNNLVFITTQGATISGLNSIANNAWSNHSGNIFKASLSNGPMFTEYMTGFNNENLNSNNTQLLAQQIFKDGEMQFLAQWPKINAPADYLERETSRGRNKTSNFSQTSITDTELGKLTPLTGAMVWINGWFLSYTRTINTHSGNTITYNMADGAIGFYKFYRVFNKLGLLTQAKEWHYENNTLYFWQQGGGSPTNVEYKVRNWGFDLRNVSGTSVIGFHFIGVDPVVTTGKSTNTFIDNIRAKYTNHSVLETRGGNDGYHDSAVQTGTKLLGAGSKIINSEFNYAAGMGVWVGSNTEITNCKFSNGDYNGQYSGFIKPYWGAGNIKITHNTFIRCGRGAIELTPETSANNLNIEIGYNDFSMFNMLNVDGGAIYGSRKISFAGMRIHHNWFHNDGGYDEAGTGKQDGIQVNGPYFDQAVGPATIDHNVFWNGIINGADIYNDIVYEDKTTPGTVIYNNTLASVNSSNGGLSSSYACYDVSPRDVQRNNIYRMGLYVGPAGTSSADVAHSIFNSTNPLFVGGNLPTDNYTPVSNPQNYFQLQSNSPARGLATAISGINDLDTSPKDAGAYYYGQAAWVPGYNGDAIQQQHAVNYYLIALIIAVLIILILLFLYLRRRHHEHK